MASRDSQKDSKVPPELAPYYDGRSSRRIVPWIVRGIVLLVIVFLLFLFFRWVWHKSHNTVNHSGGLTVSTSQPQNKSQPNSGSGSNGGNNSSQGSTLPGDESTTNNPASSGNSSSSTPSQNQSSQSGSNSTAKTGQSTTQPSRTPNTGPAGEFATFAIATAAGTILYQIRLRRKFIN